MKAYTKAYIPYKGYYTTPFSRWQGSMQYDNAVELGAATARRWFLEKKIDPAILDYMYFGSTVAQNHWFVAHNYAASILTDDKKLLPALFVNQACATSTTALNLLAKDLELGVYDVGYGLMVDRCSNGPHTIWPDPLGPGGHVDREDWNMDNFSGTPRHRAAMAQTAENVATEFGLTKEESDAVVLRRFEQYQEALANDRAFQKRYMFAPEVTITKKKKKLMEEDEGWTPTTAEGLAKLKPQFPERHTELWSPDIPGRRQLRHHRDYKGQGQRTERRSKNRDTDCLLRVCAGETDVYAGSSHSGGADGPCKRGPYHCRHQGCQDP